MVQEECHSFNCLKCICSLKVPGKGLLRSPKLPDTVLFGAGDGEFGAEGLTLRLERPMKKWKLAYKGKML
jgi:hypothetical protein